MKKQHLPTYKHDFLKEIRWLTRETDHYIFHYFAESEAEKDIDTIVSTQETAFRKIITFLSVEPPKNKIIYYFYPDREIKIALVGDGWYAQAIRTEFCVHAIYTKEIKPLGEHEDTRLPSLPLGISIGFFQEGLAEHLVGHAWDGRSHIEYVRNGCEKDLYPPLASFFEHDAWLRTDDSQPLYFYRLAGAFTTFLNKTFGKAKYVELYKKTDRDKNKAENQMVFESIYSKFEMIENTFRQYITKN